MVHIHGGVMIMVPTSLPRCTRKLATNSVLTDGVPYVSDGALIAGNSIVLMRSGTDGRHHGMRQDWASTITSLVVHILAPVIMSTRDNLMLSARMRNLKYLNQGGSQYLYSILNSTSS